MSKGQAKDPNHPDNFDPASLPPAALVYLDVWAMGVDPEGKALRVSSAAALAGVSVSAVKRWRERYGLGFRRLENQARARAGSEYGGRLARQVVQSLVVPAARRMALELSKPDGEWRAAWEVLKAGGGLAEHVEIHGTGYTAEELARDREVAEAELDEWRSENGLDTLDPAGEQPPSRPSKD